MKPKVVDNEALWKPAEFKPLSKEDKVYITKSEILVVTWCVKYGEITEINHTSWLFYYVKAMQKYQKVMKRLNKYFQTLIEY